MNQKWQELWVVSDEGVKVIFDHVKNFLSAVALFAAGTWMTHHGSFQNLDGILWIILGYLVIFFSDFLFAILSTNVWNKYSDNGLSDSGALVLGCAILLFANAMVAYSTAKH